MRKCILILCIPLLAILSNSCTKVVDINLNDADPKIIIESSITDQAGSCMVTLTKSVNYSESNTFPAVSGAIVTIAIDITERRKADEAMRESEERFRVQFESLPIPA